MELVNKEKVMDIYLFSLKFTESKSGLNMLCHVALISFTHCITEMIFTHCGMSRDLSDDVSWFLAPLSLLHLCQPDCRK